MGYRNYIGYISKKEYNKIKSLNKDELFNFSGDDDYYSVRNFIKELHELGKYCEFNTRGLTKKFFKNKDLNDYYNSDMELFIVDKQFLEMIINTYSEFIKKHYKDMMSDVDVNNEETWTKEKFAIIFQHIRSFSIEWTQLTPYNLNEGEEITTSWKYEYVVFELVRIYKSFDWKRNIMVYYGF